MLTGILLYLLIFACLLFIVLACAFGKWNPMIVLLIAAIALGLLAGMPGKKLLDTLLAGAGTVFAGIGFIIVFGTLLGEVLEKSGGAASIASIVAKKVPSRYLVPAMGGLGWLVGIPVFCDAGFIILSRLVQSMALANGLTPAGMQISLATGLYSSHVLVPPTPGPMAAAGNLGLAGELGTVIGIALIASLPPLLIAWIIIGRSKGNRPSLQADLEKGPGVRTEGPAVFYALVPLVLPLVLITVGSAVPAFTNHPEVTALATFAGHPLVALLVSATLALLLLGRRNRAQWPEWISQSLVQSGPIILITCAGGAFGAVLKATPLQDEVSDFVHQQQVSAITLYPIAYLLTALLKTAQGSSTAALIISSAILYPILGPFRLDTLQTVLVLICIGGGAMTVSHANDSYFWVIHQYGNIPVKDLYRRYTLTTLAMGLTVLITCILLHYVLV